MRRLDLISDCESCAGVCCVATSFEVSEDFAIDKPASVECPHLAPDFRCSIHAERDRRGFGGCAIYDCYGSGPRVTRGCHDAATRDARDAAFLLLREVHELLFLLTEAAKLVPATAGALTSEIAEQVRELDALAARSNVELVGVSVAPHRERSRALLLRVGTLLGGREGARAGRCTRRFS